MTCDFFELATAGVRGLQPYQPGKPIEELERELGSSEIVKLASNENPKGPSPRVKAALAAHADELARYPDGNGYALKTALSGRFGVPPEAITLGNGSNDVLELIVRGFVTPEHEVVLSRHAFAVYALATQAVGARAVVIPAVDWGQDLEATLGAVTDRTRVVFVANPNNPTGTWVDGDRLEWLAGRLPEDVLLVIDEAYREYVGEPGYPDCIHWPAVHRNVIVTRTFSKVYGLAGLRVGYCVSDASVAELLNRVRQPFNVNSAAMIAACAALEDEEHVRSSVELNREELSKLTEAFARMGLSYVPSVANFVSVDVGGDARPVYEGLLRQGVIVRPIGGYEMPNHVRVTAGLPAENARFLAALKAALSSAVA